MTIEMFIKLIREPSSASKPRRMHQFIVSAKLDIPIIVI